MTAPTPSVPGRVRWFFRVVLPLVLVGVPVLALGLLRLWEWADLAPRFLSNLQFISLMTVMASALLIPLWFVFLSGFRVRAKLIGVGVAVLVVLGVWACVGEWDNTGDLSYYPRRWRWQPSAEEKLARYQSGQDEDGKGLPPIDLTVKPADSFPRFRGPRLDGIVHGLKLGTKWEYYPPKVLWRHPCGGGFAAFAVAGNVAITLEQRGSEEAVVCYDRASGRERWKYAYPALFWDPTGAGPRATPTIDSSDVFSLGATGLLVCLDGKTGKSKWEVNILDDNHAKNIEWAMAGSPLVAGELVIVNAGVNKDDNKGQALAAYRRRDGKRVWAKGSHPAGYSSPQLARLAGRDQVLLFDAGGVAGFDLKSGGELWRYPWTTFQGMNIIQPLVFSGDRVFISSETSNGCAMLKVTKKGDKFDVAPVWDNHNMGAKFANPVAAGGYIYGLSNGILVCLDDETGERRWRGKKYGHGQLLLVGDVLLVTNERPGELVLVRASPERFEELARKRVFEDKTWNTPALAGRQLFVRNHVEMASFELPLAEE
jgi:outer membrane protein assembly factor BamB